MDSLPASPPYRCFVGVDIAAATFTVRWMTDGRMLPRALTFAQSPAGFAALQEQLQATGIGPAETLVVVEATGSDWVALAVTLHEAGSAGAVLHPAQRHTYATSLPRRGKTDALGAQVFVRVAAKRQPTPWTPPPAVYHELRQRLVTCDGVLSMRQQARNQRHALQQWPVMVASVLEHLDGVITDLDERLASVEGAWRERGGSDRRNTDRWGLGRVGRAAEHNPRHWSDHERLAAGGDMERQPVCDTRASCGRCWPRAPPAGVRHECARASAAGAWRKRAVADGVGPGEFVSDVMQPDDHGLLRAIAGSRQAYEGGTVCSSTEGVAHGVGGRDQRPAVCCHTWPDEVGAASSSGAGSLTAMRPRQCGTGLAQQGESRPHVSQKRVLREAPP